MTVKELYRFLNTKIPPSLSEEWDNDGLSICPCATRPVCRVLVALDPTSEAVARAVEGGFDVLLTHHPLLFRAAKALTEEETVGKKLLQLAAAGVTAMSFHTRLDAVEGGVNDILAKALSLTEITPFGEGQAPLGRMGVLPEAMSAVAFACFVKDRLTTPAVVLSGEGTVKRVAVLGGEGGDFLSAAAAAGADAFVSGRIGYHRMLDGREDGMVLLEAGHYSTEFPVCAALAKMVREADAEIEVEILGTAVLRVI